VFPETPLPLAWLDQVAGEIVLRADEVRLGQIDFTDASVALVLQEGRLGVQDLVLRVAGGRVTGGAVLEAQDDGDLAEVTLRLNAHDIDVAQLLADRTAGERIRGEIDIDINLDATGRSLDELMASLEGSAALVGEEGRIEDAPLDRLVTDLDILRALPPFWRHDDDELRINCLITELDIEAGVARTEALLDTERMTLIGQGTVDLGEEQLALVLRPQAKTAKLSTLAVPVDITGSLHEPEVRPRTGTAVGQALRGILGGLLIPLNQLSALFGEETFDACRQALQQAEQRADPAGAAEPSAGG
jgi:AsmA family protein